jgi:hypothetical protein
MFRAFTRLLARPRTSRKVPSKIAAVVVPAPTRAQLSADERTSLRHLTHYLGAYDKYLAAPVGSPVALPRFETRYFSKKFFGSLSAINNLWYAPQFWEAFTDYKFILWYHLDCLVFSDQLEEWCEADLDYIGPPWIRSADSLWVHTPRVGNGGIALAKVESCLRVLHNRSVQEPSTYWMDMLARNHRALRPFAEVAQRAQRYWPRSRVLDRMLTQWDTMENPDRHGRNSDLFWSDRAVHYWPEFKVASLEQGLRFGFEVAPRTCFEMNGRRMPFGCHAWPRYDREFWTPFLLASD